MNSDNCPMRLTQLVAQWDVVSIGEPLRTHASCLLPGERNGQSVMLKTSQQPDEMRGFELLDRWNGQGAVRIIERTSDAILMERATGAGSLAAMSTAGADEETIVILCQVLDTLHCAGTGQAPALVELADWFGPLFESDATEPFIQAGRALVRELLEKPDRSIALHGDMHHGNVVQLENREWRAIDPQGLCGPRGFDYANLFRNPNLAIAADPERFRSRIQKVSALSGIDRSELLGWIISLCALSHSWGAERGLAPDTDRIIGELALGCLDTLTDK